jgi:predicted amidophosphoribosyltransferase
MDRKQCDTTYKQNFSFQNFAGVQEPNGLSTTCLMNFEYLGNYCPHRKSGVIHSFRNGDKARQNDTSAFERMFFILKPIS